MPQFVTAGRTIAYEVVDLTVPWTRDTETVLFHHGIGVDGRLWREWFPMLVDRYRLVVLDMFGCGASQPDGPPGDWAAGSRVDDLLALADLVGAPRFHLVGESYGGTIALMTALRSPERVKTITVCNAAHIGSSIASVAGWERMLAEKGVEGWSEHMMEQRFFPDALPTEKRRWYQTQQSSHSRKSIVEILHALVPIDIAHQVGRIDLPALLLHADASPFVSVELMADLHRLLPRSDLQIFAHARHGLPFSHARACSQALRTFLDRHTVDGVS
jgi:pimeloyl-ACP methyl ester carboxylesterase